MKNSSNSSVAVSGKRAAIHTLGCRLNQGETRLIEDQLRESGYEMVSVGEKADLGIIHTCVVTREAEAKSRKMIHRFVRDNPGAPVVVIGCYAQTASKAIASMDGVRLVLGNDAKMTLAAHLAELDMNVTRVDCKRPERTLFTVPYVTDGEPITRRVNLKIQDGCDALCAYCYIPFARGRSRSRQYEDVLAEATALVKRGAKELVLTGVNLGDYQDGERGLTHLVNALDALHPKPRVRISSIELNTIPEELFSRMADSAHALAPHLHVPLQSGSDVILKAMGRPYTSLDYFNFINRAARAVPGIGLGADVMVGFPGETEADFEATCKRIQESALNYLHVFQYSERKQVASARMPEKVAVKTMQARSKVLRAIGYEKRRKFLQQWIGHEMEVLFESQWNGRWIGHTGNYLEVVVSQSTDLGNGIYWVRINDMDTECLIGEIKD